MISCYRGLTRSEIVGEIDVYHALDLIKNPKDEIIHLINKARSLYGSGRIEEYQEMKRHLPCVTFNFRFDERRKNKNIIEPTGFIYLDVDYCTDINFNHSLIFASWISLSGYGRGILVKVENLSKENFIDTYIAISEALNIKTDERARKASQATVLSFDKNVYINNDSIIWKVKKSKRKNPNTVTSNIKRKKDATEIGVNDKINYDNIQDLDFEGKEYLFFPDEKELIARAWIPQNIPVGSRNELLSSIAYQFRALNPKLPLDSFKAFVHRINLSRCEIPLEQSEVNSILRNIADKKNLTPLLTTPRRIVFNKESGLSAKEKRALSNKLNGARRRRKTLKLLTEYVRNWDYEKSGKITQKKLASISGMSVKTIENYYSSLKPEIKHLNSGSTLQ